MTTVITASRRKTFTLTAGGIRFRTASFFLTPDNRAVLDRRIRSSIPRLRHTRPMIPFLMTSRDHRDAMTLRLGLRHMVTNKGFQPVFHVGWMLGGKDIPRQFSHYLGSAGTGKTSVAAHFVDAACRRGERCSFFAFEESNQGVAEYAFHRYRFDDG